jgi:hypothetical protein
MIFWFFKQFSVVVLEKHGNCGQRNKGYADEEIHVDDDLSDNSTDE